MSVRDMSGQPVTSAASPAGSGDTREGFLYALFAYLLWGFLPFYMKAVSHIHPAEVVAHRVLWSVPVAGILLLILRRTGDQILQHPFRRVPTHEAPGRQ